MANNKKTTQTALKAQKPRIGSPNQIKKASNKAIGIHWAKSLTTDEKINLRHSVINALLYTIPGLFKYNDWDKNYYE